MRLHQRIRREQARHADDWLITYADTITLLLCLFVIILSIKTGGKTLARDAAAPATRAATADDIFWGRLAMSALPPITQPGARAIEPDAGVGDVKPVPEMPRLASVAVTPVAPPEPVTSAALPEPEPRAPAPPSIVDHLASRSAAIVEQHGDRITTLQISSTAFFTSGSAALSGPGKSILGEVAARLKSAEFALFHITVEGHTDDTPISTVQFQSNWELSAARAAAVVRFFLEQDIPAEKLTAAGYADTFPIAPNRNADGTVIPDNQARNRRVVIKLEKIDKSER